MESEFKVGRNDPCPCGSGKKYKNCCGADPSIPIPATKKIDLLRLNRTIAYKGRFGQQREEFCIRYMKHKHAQNEEIMSRLTNYATLEGETITCHIGCSFCCVEQIQASLQECEAIVYYLYKHERALKAFLRQFPQWHCEVSKHEAIIEKLAQLFNKMVQTEFSEESRRAYVQEGTVYARLNIPCPFLNDNKCLIYEVRPYVCANLIATTPAEWCNPTNSNRNKSKIILALPETANEVPLEVPFYYKIPHHIEAVSMPLMVYGILRGGFLYLSKLTGSDSLKAEALNDHEVKAIIQKLF